MRRLWTLLLLAFLLSAVASAGAEARSARISYYVGLERPEKSARAAFAAAGQPGSTSYRRFDAPARVARRYGAAPHVRRRLRRVARRLGFVARVDRSGVFARLSGPVRRFERVLRVDIRRQFDNDVLADSWTVRGNRRPRLPRALRPLVRETVTFSARTVKPPSAAARTRGAGGPGPGPKPGNAGTWTGGCQAARATGAYSFDQVRSAYGLAGLGTGAGAAVAILNAGESPIPADTAASGRCFGLPALKPRALLTDGQARAFNPGSPEPSEDLALVRGMSPGIGRILLSQVWLSPEAWFLGASQVLAARRLPDALSISYGECERDVRGRRAGPSSRASARLLDSLLVRLGLAGVGVFASAGDFGSTCNGDPFAGVAWPASSPYLTAVGGSRLVVDQANARVDEVVWNDLPWLTPDNGGGAGGGGLSSASARPAYQSGLSVPGGRRAVPDVAAHASMLPGWPVRFGSQWIEDAGTSASAPLVASAFALLSARERAAGRPPLGNVNGLLYTLQRSAPASFFDIVSGDNGYLPKVPARQAAPGYDLASGLGVPRFDQIAATLPAPAAAAARTGTEDLVLRLSDVGAGYRVGDDGGCFSSFGREGTSRPLVRLESRHRFRSCGLQFEEAWAPPGEQRPAEVESYVYVFRDAAGAAAGLRVAPLLVDRNVGLRRGRSTLRTPLRPVGDESVVMDTDDGLAVLWRSGRVLAFVAQGGLPAESGEATALALAERQQARIELPTRLGPRENDDLEVPLDDPRLAGLVWWLGRNHDPPGPLGRLRLSEVYPDGHGWTMGLEYAGGVSLGVWRPRAFARFRRSRLGRLVWHSPCARSTRFAFEHGNAVIYRGYGPRRDDPFPEGPIRLGPGIESGPCPKRRRNRLLAHVFLDDLVVTVNIPGCFFCIASLGGDHAYNSVAGMKAVIRALRPRT